MKEEIEDYKNPYSELNLYLKDEKGLLRMAHIVDTAATEIKFVATSAINNIEPAKLVLKSYEEKFNSDADETLLELFNLRSLIQKILNLKFNNHELCNYLIKPNETKKSWLCFSEVCKNPDYPAFKLLNY